LNIIFSDKTHYDEQVAEVVTDYIDLAKELKNLAERSSASEKEINYILEKHGRSKNRKGEIRTYNSLIEGRFRLTKVIRVDLLFAIQIQYSYKYNTYSKNQCLIRYITVPELLPIDA
jgi:hypothetical protein